MLEVREVHVGRVYGVPGFRKAAVYILDMKPKTNRCH
jgi:hypothetical protein